MAERRVLDLVAASSRCFGVGMCIAPEARLHDGRLDPVLIGPLRPLEAVLRLPAMYRGRMARHPEVECRRFRLLEVEAEDETLPVESDREAAGYRPPDRDPGVAIRMRRSQ